MGMFSTPAELLALGLDRADADGRADEDAEAGREVSVHDVLPSTFPWRRVGQSTPAMDRCDRRATGTHRMTGGG